jgi:L-serine/L-threonine ammonia-lyase
MSVNREKLNDAKELPVGVDITHDAQNDVMLAYLNHLTSRAAGSLGASSPAPGVVKLALHRLGDVRCVSVPDELSMQAAERFAGTYFPAHYSSGTKCLSSVRRT